MKFILGFIILAAALVIHPFFTMDQELELPFMFKCVSLPLSFLQDLMTQYLPKVLPIDAYQIDSNPFFSLMFFRMISVIPITKYYLVWELSSIESQKIYTSANFNITVYSKNRQSTDLRPFAIFIHGGGFIFGNGDAYSTVTQYLAYNSNRAIASIDYRLAPEFIYPAASDDCIAATRWLLSNAKEYGLDSEDVVLVGDSAGGNLVLSTVMNISQVEKRQVFKHVVPVYPVLTLHNFRSDSYTTYRNDPAGILSRRLMLRYWSYYILGNDSLVENFLEHSHISRETQEYFRCETSSDPDCINIACGGSDCRSDKKTAVTDMFDKLLRDPYLCPIAITPEEATYLPPIHLVLSRVDVLRDESILFEKLLNRYNVNVSLRIFNSFHGGFSYFIFKGMDIAITEYVVDLL